MKFIYRNDNTKKKLWRRWNNWTTTEMKWNKSSKEWKSRSTRPEQILLPLGNDWSHPVPPSFQALVAWGREGSWGIWPTPSFPLWNVNAASVKAIPAYQHFPDDSAKNGIQSRRYHHRITRMKIPSNSIIPRARNSIARAGTLLVGMGKGAVSAEHQAINRWTNHWAWVPQPWFQRIL